MPSPRRLLTVLMAGLFCLALPARAQEPHLGSVQMKNSGSPEAQEPFLRGLALLHSFEYASARSAFRSAQEADPDFALAYWGEAMAWNYPLWYRQFRDEALATLARLAPTPEERAAKAGTEAEKRWLAAVEVLYGGGSKEERDDRYAKTMAAMYRAYPDDTEVAAFYALSILGTAHEGRDHRTYMRAGAIASDLLRRHPQHPGAAHYTIHSFDDPAHAALGLHAARAYSTIAPDAAHAQHMTSHIFLALGMWEDVVRANERADAVSDRDAAEAGRSPRSCGHYNEWLEYGYLMEQRTVDALELLKACGTQSAENGRVRSFADMRSRYVIDAGDPSGEAMRIPVDLSSNAGAALTAAFLDGYVAAERGDLAGVRLALDSFAPLRTAAEADMAQRGDTEQAYVRRPEILHIQLEGLADWTAGEMESALADFEEAARIEASLPHAFGPPVIEKPSHELLGEALLEQGLASAAAEAFAEAVARAPGRIPALRGLRVAAEAAGDEALAAWAAGEMRARGIPAGEAEADD